MTQQSAPPQEALRNMAEGDLKLVKALERIIDGSFEESGLDPQTFMLVRIAALTTLDAAPASWLMNLTASGVSGLKPEDILGTLIAIAPVVGTPRVISAAGKILQALDIS